MCCYWPSCWWALWYVVILAGLRLPTELLVWCFYFVVLVVFPSCPSLTFLCVRLDWSFAYGTLAGHVLFAVLFHGISRLKIWVDPRDTPAFRPGFSICLPAVFRNFSDPPKGGTSQLQLRNALAACPACPGTLEWVHKLADDRRRTWVLKPKCSQVSVWMPRCWNLAALVVEGFNMIEVVLKTSWSSHMVLQLQDITELVYRASFSFP